MNDRMRKKSVVRGSQKDKKVLEGAGTNNRETKKMADTGTRTAEINDEQDSAAFLTLTYKNEIKNKL